MAGIISHLAMPFAMILSVQLTRRCNNPEMLCERVIMCCSKQSTALLITSKLLYPYHSVEGGAVIVAFARQLDKIPASLWCMICVKLNNKRPNCCLQLNSGGSSVHVIFLMSRDEKGARVPQRLRKISMRNKSPTFRVPVSQGSFG